MKKCMHVGCDKPAKNKYCSLSCSVGQQNLNKAKKENWIECERDGCDNTFNAVWSQSNKRFCSRACSAIRNNRARTKYKNCINCGIETSGGNKHCSRSCSYEYRYNNFITKWLSGEIILDSISPRVRKYMLENSDYRCTSETCCVPGGWSGVNQKSGKPTLTVDHIDGNATNNKISNLRVLCPNCHSLTPTFGALNIGNGRPERRARYAKVTQR